MKYLVLVLLLMIGCRFETHTCDPSNPVFNEYKESFTKDTEVKIDCMPINFKKLKDPIVGTCHMYDDPSYNYIDIDPDAWKRYNFYDKEMLIYHELGHCVLEIEDHYNGELYNDCPGSLMNEKMWSLYDVVKCYIADKDFYIWELLSHRRD